MLKNLATFFVLLTFVGCTKSNEYGACIGVADKQDPKLEYHLSLWNSFIAIAFSETIIVPVYTVAKQIQCPTGKR